MTMTHKEGIGAAIDAWFGSEVNEYIGASEKDSYRSDMEFAIRAYLDARGLVMVPKEPTEEMIIDGTNARLNTGLSTYNETPEMWRAMISAALKE